MSHDSAVQSFGRPTGPAVFFAHAGVTKFISRRLSVATPPGNSTESNASQRDASLHSVPSVMPRSVGSFAGIPSGCGALWTNSGGVARARPPANCYDASGIQYVT